MILSTPTDLQTKKFVKSLPALIHMSAPAFYDYWFGNPLFLKQFLEAAWLAEGNLFSHTEATCAADGEVLMGVELGYSGKDQRELKRGLIDVGMALLKSSAVNQEDLMLYSDKGFKVKYLNPAIPKKSYYVTTLSVVEKYRGQGVGKRLLENAIKKACSDGYREIHLDVQSDNTAVAFYERLGFRCFAKTIVPELLHDHQVPMMMRMVKAL